MDVEPAMTRGEATRRVMGELRHPSFSRRLDVFGADGSKPVVVALDADRVSETVHRVEAAGGVANVVVAQDEGFYVMAIERAQHGPGASFGGKPGAAEIHEDINMGMLVTFAEANSGRGLFTIAMGSLRASVPRSGRVPSAV